MKTLTLLRHAKSGWDDPVMRDFDRPLNAKGARAAAVMGETMRSLGLRFDHVVASPARRVVETIEQLARGYGRTIEPEWDRRLYLASASMLLDAVHGFPAEADHVLLVAHNPGLEDLVLLLAAESSDPDLRAAVAEKYPTATIAQLTIDGGWAGLTPGTARLTRFVRPRDLDPTLGPDA